MNASPRSALTLAVALVAALLALAAVLAPSAGAVSPEATAAGTQYAGNEENRALGDDGTSQSQPSVQVPLGEEVTPTDDAGVPLGDEVPTSADSQSPAGGGSGGGGERRLPFTGLLAIPVLLAGLALLTSGLLLRRRTAALPA